MGELDALMENLNTEHEKTVIRLRSQDCSCCQSSAGNNETFSCTICSVIFCNQCPDIKITETSITCPAGHEMPLK